MIAASNVYIILLLIQTALPKTKLSKRIRTNQSGLAIHMNDDGASQTPYES
jgi:hypothetical protein